MFPIYFKAVAHVPALQVLAHRVVWSLLSLGFVFGRRRRLEHRPASARIGRIEDLLMADQTSALALANDAELILASDERAALKGAHFA